MSGIFTSFKDAAYWYAAWAQGDQDTNPVPVWINDQFWHMSGPTTGCWREGCEERIDEIVNGYPVLFGR